MTDVSELVAELKDIVSWQPTPLPLTDDDYFKLVRRGIRFLYVKTQRASAFSDSKFDTDSDPITFVDTLMADEIEYVLLKSQSYFFQRVQTDVNTITSYSSDALTVAHADQPYKHLSKTIAELEALCRLVYMKMIRFGTVARGGQ